ncbi:cytochrome oxidase assembly [Halosimplex carlsbadense 2-9-1]|uniref:Cytochrome oxidase assembly n=1 Tax=Halosimplex carlsbadense 2-9-1 TaxID=797114 RepID=M0CHB9_9EURY|nr:COX15/CtaA family protein [Halosimplex carlsbadense]ELZ22690.1 cytochrome oxidase assembly [Halosimplex carlsbadense 2-9-1]
MSRRFRILAGVTTALTFVLILLGLHTGSTGGGLSCGTRWPLCNGWLGLFPANWASFFEWIHRFFAMVVGFLLLGWLYGVWRWQDDRRVRYAVTAAIAILPAQIVLGGVTTTAGGMFPRGFNPLIQTAHFTTATLIFALLVYATVRIFDTPGTHAVRTVVSLGGGLVALAAVFEFVAVFDHPPTNRITYYAVSFALLAAFVALLVWSGDAVDPANLLRFRAVTAVATALLYVTMVLSRQKWGLPDLYGEAATVLLAVAVVGLAVLTNRVIADTGGFGAQRAD